MKKRIILLFLCVLLLVVLLPAAICAEGGEEPQTPIKVDVEIWFVARTIPYDGQSHSYADFRVVIKDDPSGEFRADYVSFTGTPVTGTLPGTYSVANPSSSQFVSSDPRFKLFISRFNKKDNKLTINATKVAVDFYGLDKSFDYDGTPHTLDDCRVSVCSAADPGVTFDPGTIGLSYTLSYSRTETDAGTYDNVTPNVSNLAITDPGLKIQVTRTHAGTLTIKPADVYVDLSGTDMEVEYDGEEHTLSCSLKITGDAGGLFKPEYLSYDGPTSISGTDAGEYKLELHADQIHNSQSRNFRLIAHSQHRKLTITPAKVTVTVTGRSAEYPYDGTEKTLSGYDIAIEPSTLYKKEYLSCPAVDPSVSGTDAGTYDLSIPAGDFANTNKNFNMALAAHPGKLTITPAKVTVDIKGKSASFVYNGQTRTVKGYSVKIHDPLGLYQQSDISFSGSAKVSGKAVGTYKMTLTDADFSNTDPNFEVLFNVTPGKLVIKQAPAPKPTPEPSPEPTAEPSPEPSAEPSPEPSAEPSPEPSPEPSAEPEPTPEVVADPGTPAAGLPAMPIVNLISAILSFALGLGAALKSLKANKDDDEDERKRLKRKRLSFIPGVGSVAAFLLTEPLLTRLKLVDKWTPLMLVLLLANLAISYWTREKKQEPEAGTDPGAEK